MPGGIVIIAIVAVSAGAISQIIKSWLNRPGRAGIPQSDLREIRAGLGQLQQAVDAIAIEVERLSEGQRFTTKLLSEKAREVAPERRVGWRPRAHRTRHRSGFGYTEPYGSV